VTIAIAIAGLVFLILIHEAGHFFVARGVGMRPRRFYIFFPPAIWKRTRNGASFSGPEGEISSYYSYGKRVLAVANGTVLKIKDGIPDNKPGHVGAEALNLSRETIAGNVIVLELGSGQYAYYAHLQPGSLRVKAGQRVHRGEVIALVGNSGSSFEPHLHFEVTTSPETLAGEGLPYLLDEYDAVIDGVPEHRRRELPTRGTIVNFASVR